MKKIYYLLALTAVAACFSACRPLDKTYDAIGPVAKPTVPPAPAAPTIAAVTLTADDYFFLPPVNPAQTLFYFRSDADAIDGIPSILTKKYPDATDKSQIAVTYSLTPSIPSFKPADSVYTHVAYTLADPADYLSVSGVTHDNFNDANVLSFLAKKYPTPVNNQLAVLTFNYYVSGVATSVQQSFIYGSGAWKKIYTVTPAQYTSIGKGGTSNDFAAADELNLAAYFSNFLNSDPTIASTAKAGDVQYVSFKYYGGSAANTFQRVIPLAYDGIKWVSRAVSSTETFGKTNGQWGVIYDNSVSYTLVSPTDYAFISAVPNVATASGAAADLKKYNDFTLTGGVNGATRWTDADIAKGIDALLQSKYGPVASNNQKFTVTFKIYGPYATESLTFKYADSTKDFAYIPVPNTDKYTLTGDDYVTVLGIPNVASTAAVGNLTQYGNFSYSAGWTDDQINTGLVAVLKLRYPAATTNQQVAVSFGAYKSGNTTLTRSFKFDGTTWTVVQ